MARCRKSSIIFTITFLAVCANGQDWFTGDLNGNCLIDKNDLRLFAEQWLNPSGCSGVGCADFDGKDGVNFKDFALLAAASWNRKLLLISEVMASNNDTLEDPQEPGEYPDWIELYNAGSQRVCLGGLYLTDNDEIPNKFRIPDSVYIDANSYLVFFADDDPEQGDRHTNFKIKLDGDDIYLFAADANTPIDSVTFGQQATDISYGRYPDSSDSWQYMGYPTPGAKNNGGYLGQVEDTKFSVDRGFYNAPFQVRLACDTDGVTIRYTTNGQDPVEPNGLVYNDNSPVQITKSTCLRAAAYKAGWLPSNTDTQTYIFVSNVINQSTNAPGLGWPTPGDWYGQTIDYQMDPDVTTNPSYADLMDDALLAIPSICLSTDLENLFDPTTGIYVNCGWYGYPGWERGDAWKRPVSVELINPDGSKGFQINAGLGMRGITSCQGSNPKHAFRLFFENRFGDGPLNFPLFGDEGANSFDRVDLRCEQNYSWNMDGDSSHTAVREVFCRDLMKAMGEPTSLSRYYHLYINSVYLGLYQTEERPESNYGATYFGGDNDDYDTVKPNRSWPRSMECVDGNFAAYKRLWQACLDGFETDLKYFKVQGQNTNGSPNPAYERLVDVNNLIDLMLSVFYTGDFDSPISSWYSNRIPNNFFGLYNRVNPDGFKYFRHDGEHTMWNVNEDRTGPFWASDLMNFIEGCPVEPWPSQICIGFNPQTLHQYLVAHPEYVLHFADRVRKFFFNDGPMSVTGAQSLFASRAAEIDLAIIAESARWGDAKTSSPLTKNNWLSAIAWVLDTYMATRTSIVINQFKNKGWYPSIDAPAFNINGSSKYGGQVNSGDLLTMTAPTGTIYYTLDGSDPRLLGGAVNPNAHVFISASQPITFIAESATNKKIFVPSSNIGTTWKGGSEPFDDSAWTHGTFVSGKTGGVGYDRNTSDMDYRPYISYNVESLMYNTMTSCYIRIPFSITSEDLAKLNSLTLNVRCDDGFVAYINGQEVASINKPNLLLWNSSCANRANSVDFVAFDITNKISALQAGNNILAVQAMNQSTTSSDFLCSVELKGTIISASSDSIVLTESTRVEARALNSGQWSALSDAIFAVGTVAENLRITEIMYHPLDTGNPNDPNTEFIELKNIGGAAINLRWSKFTKGIHFTFPDVNLAAGQYIVVVKDVNAFTAKYGSGISVAGQYTGSLDNAGERIKLEDAIGWTVLDFKYQDGWRNITDGEGYSLTINNESSPDTNSWSKEDSWSAGTYFGGTPGYGDNGPKWGDVVINEVLAHQDAYPEDWIELHNTTGSPINITGWYLSDSDANLTKYQIPSATIAANGYIVFTEDNHFGSCFALSENGETVYLTGKKDANSKLTGYRQKEEFGASEQGVAFGRYLKSTGTYNFVPMSQNTPGDSYQGAPNAYPKVGPIIISEIMYRPEKFWGNWNAEYIELYNTSDSTVNLYNTSGVTWKFTDGINFEFLSGISIASHSYLLVVRNLTAFTTEYPGIGVQKLQWTSGKLNDDGETVEISMPGDINKYGQQQYIRIDRVSYSNGSHPENFDGASDPWPVQANGTGYSLTRLNYNNYGNDPNNWIAYPASPGQAGLPPAP